MTPKTLWIIILKTLGVYTLLQIYNPLIQLVSLPFTLTNPLFKISWQGVGYMFLSIVIYLTIVFVLIFKSEWLINKLRLESNISEERIEINIHRSSVLAIVVMLAGILIFTDSLPLLLKELYSYFGVINDYADFKKYPHAGTIISELTKVIISFFMMTSSRLIVNFIEVKRTKAVTDGR